MSPTARSSTDPVDAPAASRLVRNSFFSVLQTGTTMSFALVASVVLGRTLGAHGYGRYSYVMWLAGVLAIVASAGLPSAMTRYVAEFGRTELGVARKLFRRLLLLGTGFAGLGGAALLAYGIVFLSAPGLVIAGLLYFLVLVVTRLQASGLAGLQEYRKIAVVTLVVAPLNLALVLAAAGYGAALPTFVLAYVAAGAVQAALLAAMARRAFLRAAPSRPLPVDLRARIVRYAGAVYAVGLIDAVVWQKSEVFFLERYTTANQVAFYSLGYTLAYALMQLPVVCSNVLFPFFVETVKEDGPAGLQRRFRLAVKYLALLVMPMVAAGLLVARPLVATLYGEGYGGTVAPLVLLLVTGAVVTVARPVSVALYSTEHQHLILRIGVVLAIVNIGLDLWLIPAHGAIGAAVANGAAQAAGVLAGVVYVTLRLGQRFPAAAVGRVMFTAAVAAAPFAAAARVFELGDTLTLTLTLPLYPVAYLLLLKPMRALDAADDELIGRALAGLPPFARAVAGSTLELARIGRVADGPAGAP